MKLRLRSTANKQTLKIEVPSDCTLPQLKHVITNQISHASAPSNVTVSLNRKDELIGLPDAPLQSLGIASGDLLFYTTDFTSSVPNSQALGMETTSLDVTMGDSEDSVAIEVNETLGLDVASFDTGDSVDIEATEVVNSENETLEIGDGAEDDMEVDDKRLVAPHFLKNVLKDEGGKVLSGYGLLVVAVQAVLVDAGFVRLDLETGVAVSEFQVPGVDNGVKPLTLRYTVGGLLQSKSVGCEFVTVRMYKQGCVLFVYGDMNGNKNGCYVLKLDEVRYGKSIELELRRKEEGSGDSGGGPGLFLSEIHDSEVFRFYKEVKDKLVLPLLIDLCDKAGLPLPPCLMLLPTELKLKIFELVGGADLAKLACQCSELRYLASDNSLWKMKCMGEFGDGGGDDPTNWKRKFISLWKMARETERVRDREVRYSFDRMNRLNRIHRPPPPFGAPFIIGGDYDLYPFGDAGPYRAPYGGSSGRLPSFPYPSFQPSRRFSPNLDHVGGGLL